MRLDGYGNRTLPAIALFRPRTGFANQLTAELNTAPQFDFDYTPAEGDVINIETVSSGRKNIIELQFSAGQWQQQRQNSSHLNRNLEIGSGVLVQR